MITNPIQVKIINPSLAPITIWLLLSNSLVSVYPIIVKMKWSTIQSFIFFVIIFHNIAPLNFSELIPYFVMLVLGNFTTLSHLKL